MYVQNGRLMGNLKRAVRVVVEKYELPIILTNQQNMVLTVSHCHAVLYAAIEAVWR